jgi:hypothetical protein
MDENESGDELYVNALIENAATWTQIQADQARSIATNESALRNRLVSPDGHYVAIAINHTYGAEIEQQAINDIGSGAYALADKIKAEHPDLDIYVSGIVVMDYANIAVAIKDMATLTPLMYVVMFTLLATLLRSAVSMVAVLILTLLTVVGSIGIALWLDIVFSAMSMASISIIITICIAHCVHILVYFLHSYRKGTNKHQALEESLRINLQPIFLTSFTTAIGFLSMNFSEMPPAAALGNISAIGVTLAFILSISALPALLLMLPIKQGNATDDPKLNSAARLSHQLDKLADLVIRRRHQLLISSLLISVLMLYFSSLNIVNDRFSEVVKSPNRFTDENAFIDKHLGGLYNIDYDIAALDAGGISEPEYLQKLDQFTQWLRQQPEVTNVFSYSDVIKRLNQNMHGDDPAYYRIPENRELAAQFLLLYEMSLPYGMELKNQIRDDKGATRLVVVYPSMGTQDILALRQKIINWQTQNLPAYMQHEGAGYTMMWSFLSYSALTSSVEGALLALALISAILMLVLRSWRYGLISIVPNLLPAGIGFGVWALAVGELNMGLMNVLIITIGIVVDDTVHFLSKYKRARDEQGANAQQAVRAAFHSVGPALWITTLVLMTGFGLLAFSSFVPNSTMGLLVAIVLIAALLLDFFLLPPLLMLIDR